MPPQGKLPKQVIADFEQWIKMGAPDPRTAAAAEAKGIDWNAARKHWAFQTPHKAELPKVKNAGWVKTPIDQFILARLEAENLQPVAPAAKRELLRRATFDLT